MKLATHLHTLQVIKCVELHWDFAMYLHGVVLDAAEGNVTFRRVCEIAKGDYQLRILCLCVCLLAWKNSAPTGRIFMKFYIRFFS